MVPYHTIQTITQNIHCQQWNELKICIEGKEQHWLIGKESLSITVKSNLVQQKVRYVSEAILSHSSDSLCASDFAS